MLERKVADLEHKVVDLELERDELAGSEDRHHKRLRPGIEQLEERLRRAELELVASDRLKDALHAEKAKVGDSDECKFKMIACVSSKSR